MYTLGCQYDGMGVKLSDWDGVCLVNWYLGNTGVSIRRELMMD